MEKEQFATTIGGFCMCIVFSLRGCKIQYMCVIVILVSKYGFAGYWHKKNQWLIIIVLIQLPFEVVFSYIPCSDTPKWADLQLHMGLFYVLVRSHLFKKHLKVQDYPSVRLPIRRAVVTGGDTLQQQILGPGFRFWPL